MVWQGCSQSESALITGTEEYLAKSCKSSWRNTRATMQSTYPDSTRATSETGSRTPRPTSSPPMYRE